MEYWNTKNGGGQNGWDAGVGGIFFGHPDYARMVGFDLRWGVMMVATKDDVQDVVGRSLVDVWEGRGI